MKILVASNLYPPAFIGGYEIGASWIIECLKARGHEILLLTCDQIFAKRNGAPLHLVHEPETPFKHIDLGLCLYEFDVINQLIVGQDCDGLESLTREFSSFLETYPEKRIERLAAIEAFGAELVLVFNPACILAPVFDELDSLPSLVNCPRTAFVSDDWMARWPTNHPLIFLKDYHDAVAGKAKPESEENALFLIGRKMKTVGLLNFDRLMAFDRTLFCSRFLMERTLQHCSPGGPTVAHWGLPGIDTYPHCDPEAFLAPRPLRIAYCGQVAPHKGLGSLLRALTFCRAPHSLVVIGNDQTDHGAFCRSFVEEAGLGDRVTFTGTLAPDDVPGFLASNAEVFIHPSESDPSGFEEPFSIVLIQAMACGLAVAASNSGGSPEALKEGVTGLHFNAGDAGEIAAVLDRLEHDRLLAQNLAKAARELAMREYGIETMTEHILGPIEDNRPDTQPIPLFLTVNNASLDPANSGCVRVTRRLGRELQDVGEPIFIRWNPDTSEFAPLTDGHREVLGRFNGPIAKPGRVDKPPRANHPIEGWLILPELMDAESVTAAIRTARAGGLKVASIFYDAIPLLRPEFCNEKIQANHAAYMRSLAGCDLVIPISHFSADCLTDLWQSERIPPCEVVPLLLPGDFGKVRPNLPFPPNDPPVEILCVSTLEPRKNHRRLINALAMVEQEHPELDWSLHLVGNQYEGARELAEFIIQASRRNPRIIYHGIVDDEQLVELYNRCHFTVYPSLIEGYGLPILESIFFNRPCICSNSGVMAELAAPGGCLTVNVEDEASIAGAIGRLGTDLTLRKELSLQCHERTVSTWQEYARSFHDLLTMRSMRPRFHAFTPPEESEAPPQGVVDRTFYRGLLTSNWQMSDSERLAIMGILQATRPENALEIGTYQGGSLSLISGYAKQVVSIDIDPEIPGKFRQFQNVEFLTAYSEKVLPMLFREMKAEGKAFQFILIDGDHSKEGVRRDINLVLEAMDGSSPCVIMIHDSFNPDCRNGILNADWGACPWVHHVDLDFIPGRIVQQNGPFDGEMWGGLALALIDELPRNAPLRIDQSASSQFTRLAADC